MTRVKLTKGELKRQRDNLKRFQRYLPMLELKQQQLQLEVLKSKKHLKDRQSTREKFEHGIRQWARLLVDRTMSLTPWIKPNRTITTGTNIAGVDIRTFEKVIFKKDEYNLYDTPLWVDVGIERLKEIAEVIEEMKIIKEGLERLQRELLITSQRVNLFDEIKIPECEENIRVIRIYLGDQEAAAVGRSKIAKKKIKALEEVGV